MLRRAQAEFKPGVTLASPDCAPWSVSSSSKDPAVRLAERNEARPSLEFTMELCSNQAKHDRGYNVEQPLGSAMFQEDLPENPLHLSSIPGNRKRQRVDQCMMGAEDEEHRPIQKATGFGSNFKWSKTALRCSGHKGKSHAHLQGNGPDGLTRTSKAAAYPRAMCQKMRQDIIRFLHQKNLLQLGKWPEHLRHFSTQHFYECTRCQLGKACPPDVPHTYVHRECRLGQKAKLEAKEKKEKDKHLEKEKEKTAVTQRATSSTKTTAQKMSPLDHWKELANRENMNRCELNDTVVPYLDAQQRHFLKKLLADVIKDVLASMKGQKGREIAEPRWIDDQVQLAMFKDIFKGHLLVRGVRVQLQAFHKSAAQPQLAFSSSYLRMVIRGHSSNWTVGPMEDLRELTVVTIRSMRL